MALTINLSGVGAGDIFIEDDGIVGTGISQIRSASGAFATFTFAHPADSLTIIGAPGQTLTIDLVDSLGAASLTVGSLTDPTANPAISRSRTSPPPAR